MNDKEKLSRLDEMVVAEIMAKSDAEILGEVGSDEIAAVRADFERAKLAMAKSRLANAKAAVANARSRPGFAPRSNAQGADALRSARSRDRGFDQKLTLAARSGQSDYEADKPGIEEDLAELESWKDDHGSNS